MTDPGLKGAIKRMVGKTDASLSRIEALEVELIRRITEEILTEEECTTYKMAISKIKADIAFREAAEQDENFAENGDSNNVESQSQSLNGDSQRRDNNGNGQRLQDEQSESFSQAAVNQEMVSVLQSLSGVRFDELPSFEGSVLAWPAFRQVFEDEVLYNDAVPRTRKRTFMMKCLIGRAKEKIDQLSMATMNPDNLWDKLKEYYEDDKRIKEELDDMLYKLPKIRNREDYDNLKKVRDQIRTLIEGIKSIDVGFRQYLQTYVPAVANVFWSEEKRNIIERNDNLDEVLARIEDLAKRAIRYNRNYRTEESKNFRNNFSHRAIQHSMENCVFCNGSHTSIECNQYMLYRDKRRIVLEKRLCRKCLKPYHREDVCPVKSTIKCGKCSENHPTSLHNVRFTFSPEITAQAPSSMSAAPIAALPGGSNGSSSEAEVLNDYVITNVHSMIEDSVRPILKGTVNNISAKILLDSGAEVSVISPLLVKPHDIRKGQRFSIQGVDQLYPPAFLESFVNVELLCHEGKNIHLMVYIHPHLKLPELIIGGDNIRNIWRKESRPVMKTIWGDIPFGKSSIKNVRMMEAAIDDNEIYQRIPIRIEKVSSGRYMSTLPFRSDMRPRDNYWVNLTRLDKWQARLERKGLHQEVEDNLFKLLNEGQAEIINETDGYFIPLQEVVREDSPSTPVRVVGNASFGKISLNDVLDKMEVSGLDVLPHLLRSRNKKFLLLSDMKKAFLQILIAPEHRKYLRFVWRTKDQKLIHLQMTALPFGLVCSPAILTKIIQEILQKVPARYHEVLLQAFYMDDGIMASNDESLLLEAYQHAVKEFEDSGFSLHKLKTNSSLIEKRLGTEKQEDALILGVQWNMHRDTMSIKLRFKEEGPIGTKRQLASFVARWYDPCGLTEAVKLRFRLAFSKISRYGWDEPISEEEKLGIQQLLDDVKLLDEWQIPRYVAGKSLNVFADASKKGYGYAIFLDQTLIFGKSKISPIRTIPSLELLALYEAVALVRKIHMSLDYEKIVVFSDSKITLDRLNLPASSLKFPVALKITQLQRWQSEMSLEFRHIRTEINPADVFSRGIDAKTFITKQLWITNLNNATQDISDPCPVRQICTVEKRILIKYPYEQVKELASIDEMLDVVTKVAPNEDPLNFLIRTFQSQSTFPSKNFASKLQEGVIHVVDRDLGHPQIWIPAGPLAQSLLVQAHQNAEHNGVNWSLAQLARNLWISNKQKLMKKIIHNCSRCKQLRAKPMNPPLGPLADIQTQFLKNFEAVAVDLMGPFSLTNGTKFYVLVAVCFTTRYVAMEYVSKQTTDELFKAMTAVFSIHGYPKFILSDNGSNFVAVRKMLQRKVLNLKWHHSTPGAPWTNGAAERAVRSCKQALNIYDQQYKSQLLVTRALKDAEFVMNSRPVLHLNQPISAFELKNHRPPLEWDLSNINQIHHEKYVKHRQEVARCYEKIWSSQYLEQLRKLKKINFQNITPGEKVIIPKLFKNRRQWPVAEVLETETSADGIVRTIWLQHTNGNRQRCPVKGLVNCGRGELL